MGLPDQGPNPAALTYNGLAEMADRLACAIAGHERAAELFALFGETFHVEQKRLEMEAQLMEAERLGQE